MIFSTGEPFGYALFREEEEEIHLRDVVSYNRDAWNRQARGGSRWCTPVGTEEVEAARRGDWRVILTPNKSVPKE